MSYLNKIYNRLKITSAPTESDDVARKNETDALDAAKAGIDDNETITGTWQFGSSGARVSIAGDAISDPSTNREINFKGSKISLLGGVDFASESRFRDDAGLGFGTNTEFRLVYDSAAGIFRIKDAANGVNLASFSPNGPVNYPNGLESGTSPVLTQADEGAGNGLNADTVDGEHATDFADAAHNHTGDSLGTSSTPVSSLTTNDIDQPNLGASAYLSADTSISSTTFTRIPYDTTVFDDLGEYDTSNNLFTASRAGRYHINAGGKYRDFPDGTRAIINVNIISGGTTTTVSANEFNAGSGTASGLSTSASVLVELGANDQVEVLIYQDSGGTQDLRGNRKSTNVQVYKVG